MYPVQYFKLIHQTKFYIIKKYPKRIFNFSFANFFSASKKQTCLNEATMPTLDRIGHVSPKGRGRGALQSLRLVYFILWLLYTQISYPETQFERNTNANIP